eukprot:scaffold25722_cov109-Isochrysis_galbana.AAC.6
MPQTGIANNRTGGVAHQVERLLVDVARLPHLERRLPLPLRHGIPIDIFDRGDAVVAVGACPRELATNLNLPWRGEEERRGGVGTEGARSGRWSRGGRSGSRVGKSREA